LPTQIGVGDLGVDGLHPPNLLALEPSRDRPRTWRAALEAVVNANRWAI
jgi:hypothetical protein